MHKENQRDTATWSRTKKCPSFMSKLLLKVKAINTSRGCRCFLNKFFSTLSKPQLRRVFSIDEIPCLTRMRHVTVVLQEFRETYSLHFLRT